jgi:hypothetical protein
MSKGTNASAKSKRNGAVPSKPSKRRGGLYEAVAFEKELTPDNFAARGPVIPAPAPVAVGGMKLLYEAHDQDFRKLCSLRDAFLERAALKRAPWLVATANILSATVLAMTSNALALPELEELHKVARKQLQGKVADAFLTTPDGESHPMHSRLYVAVHTSDGKLTDSIAPGFDALVNALHELLKALRRAKHVTLERGAGMVADVMANSFPGVTSIVAPIAKDYESGITSLGNRVNAYLGDLGKKHADGAKVDPLSAAKEIAEGIVRAELKLSGKSAKEIEATLHFIAQRDTPKRLKGRPVTT